MPGDAVSNATFSTRNSDCAASICRLTSHFPSAAGRYWPELACSGQRVAQLTRGDDELRGAVLYSPLAFRRSCGDSQREIPDNR